MNKKYKYSSLILCMLFLGGYAVGAPYQYSDSLNYRLRHQADPKERIRTLGYLTIFYINIYPDSAIILADEMIVLARQAGDRSSQALAYYYKGFALDHLANYAGALQAAYKVFEISDSIESDKSDIIAKGYELLGHLYGITGNGGDAIKYFNKGIALIKSNERVYKKNYNLLSRLSIYLRFENKDSANYLANLGYQLAEKQSPYIRSAFPYLAIWNSYNAEKKSELGLPYLLAGIDFSRKFKLLFYLPVLQNSYANYLLSIGKKDSALVYASQALEIAKTYKFKLFEMGADEILFRIYEKNNTDSAFKYIRDMITVRNQIFSQTNGQHFQLISSEETLRKRDLEEQKKSYLARIRIWVLATALVFFLVIVIILFRNNKLRQRAYKLLMEQKRETDQQKEKTLDALKALRNAQAELIQSEKMASLGELTAGIAHEIQNPLNFVNNFSEINNDLIDELQQEADKGNIEEVKTIAQDIKQNEQKINHHGKRADAIVKGMLQHSRTNTGIKEPGNINALSEEYLRLSYHGFRARDKSFNANMVTDLDKSIPLISMVPQDIGRVILNLLNNAFYAAATVSHPDLKPTVWITTENCKDHIKLSIRDNGPGISEKIRNKIFQPFFTTKPTGQGTGLGLSLSYDIVNAHGGDIKVETKEGEGTTFVITLPVTT